MVMSGITMVESGVPGFDEILGKGLVRGSCIILHGGPGSGKTTLAAQFVYRGAVESGEPGVYVTLSENPEEIRSNMLNFGWDLAKLEKQKKLVLIDARPVTFTDEGYIVPNEALFKGERVPFSHISKLIIDTVRGIGAKRLAIDSITVLTAQYESASYVRQGMLGLIQILCSLDCTSLLLSEDVRGDGEKTPIEWFLVPGVIILHYARRGSSMVRAIQVLKFRGLKHSPDIYHMEIGNEGVVIHPEERAEF